MLPFSGQGSNTAMEDGGALGYLFRGIQDPAAVEKQARLFELVRKQRVSRIQILSTVRANREKDVEQELKKYADPPGSGRSRVTRKKAFELKLTANVAVPTSLQERTDHDYMHDVFAKCDEVIGQSQTMVN